MALLQVQLIPDQASTFAVEVDLFYIALWLLTIVFSIGVAAAAAYLMHKYKRQRTDQIGVNVHGAMILEVTWTVIPFIMAMGIFLWGAKLYYEMYKDPRDAMEIYVTAKQWMFRAQHPDGRREINELHIPMGRRIKLTMTSEDVLHAYFIPAFRTKADIVPGRYTSTWFEATKPGSYHLFCAEYCGTQHSGMVGTVYVMEPAEYQAWLADGSGNIAPAEVGKKIFATMGCNTCHKEDNSGRGPSLLGVYGSQVKLTSGQAVLADDAYVRESILRPHVKIVAGYPLMMSTYQGQLTEEQIVQVIAYLKSIGKQEANAAGAAAPAAPATGAPALAAPAAGAPVPPAGAAAKPVTRPATKPAN
ncbi:MAG: cytochrome c oxidase subunit II [Acidobacteria bacterium]|nr:cytochrome c oxidase subunit II [Acidobacteriota bacterium]MBI3421607.1 cytochrome c oxidase subunit II [Acidobacteriota bacterium]